MCGPRGLPFARNRLFHNDGKGRFTDVSATERRRRARRAATASPSSRRTSTTIGYPDLYVACDSTPSLLYRNQEGRHVRGGRAAVGRRPERGRPGAGRMGVAVADYDEDGHMRHRQDQLQRRRAEPLSQQRRRHVRGSRVCSPGSAATCEYVGWGVHLARCRSRWATGPPDDQRSRLPRGRIRRRRSGTGSRACSTGTSATAGSRISRRRQARESREPLLVARLRGRRPRRRRLARGRGEQHGRASEPAEELRDRDKHWLLVAAAWASRRTGMQSARASSCTTAGRRVSGEVQSGSSYISQNDARLHVGLSTNESYERIEVIWPGGMRELFPAGKADRVVTLTQGTGSRPPGGSTKIGPSPPRPESRR